jgi:ABC-type antimicrobial peptide transport system permease subunit
MPTSEQKIINTRYLFGFGVIPFIFACMFGQATLFPLVLNYNYTPFPTNWFIAMITFTLFILLCCLYMAVRVLRDTYADFIF